MTIIQQTFFSLEIVFSCIAAWIQPGIFCCLKMRSVENILGYIQEQFYRFSRGYKPWENLWICSILGNKKLSLNQNVWRDHVIMQQDVLLHFRLRYKKNILLSSSRAFSCLFKGWTAPLPPESNPYLQTSFFIVYPLFFIVYPCGQQWGYMEKSYKMQQTHVKHSS